MEGKIGLKGGLEFPDIPLAGEGKWYVRDGEKIFGPISWSEINQMAISAQVTPQAQIRKEKWPQWVPITMYFRVKTRKEYEREGLKPNHYDAILSIFVFIFLMGAFIVRVDVLMGIMLMSASYLTEIFILGLEIKQKNKALTRAIGNAIVLAWIVIQFLLMTFLISLVI
jgi:hypothetical protein